MVGEISPERVKYHHIVENFIRCLVPGCLVYDIGKSHIHNYKKDFVKFDYKTIDRDNSKGPDILLDIEGINDHNVEQYLNRGDALLCNGVIEQCSDPIQMIRSCNSILKPGGLALFGFVLLGYPQHNYDWFRFTASGACGALKRCGFKITYNYIVERSGIQSYIYVMCSKE